MAAKLFGFGRVGFASISLLVAMLGGTSAAVAQSELPAISGRVVDPDGLPVPSVQVRVISRAVDRRAVTSESGEFEFTGLQPANYRLECSAAGFAIARQQARPAAAPLTIQLALAVRREEMTISAERLRVRTDADANADAVALDRSLLDTLPSLDNNYLATVGRLLDPSSSSAGTTLIVDGMEARNAGVTASAIQEIRINQNPYTAEYPRWSRRRIEVITKTAADAYHGTLNFLFRDYHLNAREPLAATRAPEQRRIWEGSLFGPVGHSKKTSFLLSGTREDEELQALVYAQRPSGLVRENVATPRENTYAALRVSHQFSDRQAAFWQVNYQDTFQYNLGVGGTVLAEAGATRRFREDELTFNHRYTITPRLLSQFRILLGRYHNPLTSNITAPKAVVTDAFTGGGAQADRLSTEFHTSITWLLTQTHGKHSLKYGINVPDWSRRGLRDESDYLGTLSYASLAAFQLSRPFAAVIQQGNPTVVFTEKNAGFFVQDDWQMRSGFALSLGLRYDWQNYFGDAANFSPRAGLAWAPPGTRKWVVRSGAGFFYDRSGPGPIWDILRYDGIRQRRYVITGAQPPPPDLSLYPTSIARLDPSVQLPTTLQFSAGVERQMTRKTTLAINYVGVRGTQQFRSRDANAPQAPLFNARPDSTINVFRQIESAGRVSANALEVDLRGDIAPRLSGVVQYTWRRILTDVGGLDWYPAASYAPSGEWGRADTDRRHRFNMLATVSLPRKMNLGLAVALSTGNPYNITTGGDENADGLPLDRPLNFSRNTGLGPGLATVDARWSRVFRLSQAPKDTGPSLTVALDAFNIFNTPNYPGYVGSLRSPFFGGPVSSLPARRLQISLRFQF